MFFTISLILAIVFAVMSFLAWRSKLKMNSVFGIRTPSLMQSEEIWIRIHRRFSFAICLVSFIFLIAAALSYAASHLEYENFARLARIASYVLFALNLAFWTLITYLADTAARKCNQNEK